MANPNYHKIGYSVHDVASIFGCTPQTVVSMIDRGELDAHCDPPVKTAGRRRTIRVYRDQLVDYMRSHRKKFDDSLLKQYGALDDPKPEAAADDDDIPDEVTGEELMANPELRNKVFARMAGVQPVQCVAPKPVFEPREDKAFHKMRVIADGKFIVDGCSKITAGAIVAALLEDPFLSVKRIEVYGVD